MVWDIFHEALQPVIQAWRMGCVMFQFQVTRERISITFGLGRVYED